MTIKEMRALLGLTQAAFSKKYKIKKRTLEDWESGKSNPPEHVLYLLERAVKEDYNSMSSLDKYATDVVRKQVMELDKDDLTEQEIIDNRFL